MPLPAELAVRLSKRGILTPQTPIYENTTQEEVIAEDYDDKKGSDGKNNQDEDGMVEYTPEEIQYKIKGYPGCPNKYNIYHECTSYCKEKYGNGKVTPDPKYMYLKNKMLMKYPLPEGWQEVYDPGTGRHYYWEYKSDAVSWLPPGHPKHVLSEPAAVAREEVKLAESEDESESEENGADESVPTEKERRRQHIERQRSRGRPKIKENDLDPMDPAAYSDIPRGKWSAGLIADVKTGVDSTVSGPLYQQRPYPSPGDILRRNKSKQPTKTGSVSFPELPPS
ncbi:hypothetical protein RUM43_011178 [Polyplax serrata]|uniref:WW domain-containing protein n=1 Tax=Polyplax serrata TaxID=468196 RepID=A0AAN8S022_POLSC